MLGLLAATDERWADAALADLDAVLRDHAHCEMKAASNAMSLAARHPDDMPLVRKLVAIAQEELAHFDRVLSLLVARGIPLGTPPVDEYAAELRARVAALPHTVEPVVDRLLVCALIEARSCERFKLLVDRLNEPHELHVFYKELFAAEARHFREFVALAIEASSEDVANARLRQIALIEAEIVRKRARAPLRASIHG